MSEAIVSLQERIESAESRTGFQGKMGPFTPWIQAEKCTPKVKPFKIEKYNGIRDPYHHLEVFQSLLHGTRYTDAMACHMFEETLTDEALRWFLNLPPNSIDSFQELGDKFLCRFILCGSGYCTTPDLFRLKQWLNERLRDFVRRWKKQATQCCSLDPALAASTFKQALQPGYFLLQINTNPPATYGDLLDAATAFAQAEYDTFGRDTNTNTHPVNAPQLTNPIGTTDSRNKDTTRDKPVQYDRTPRERQGYNDKRDKQYRKSLEKPKYNSSSSRYRNAPYGGTRHKENQRFEAPRYEIYTTLIASYEEIWNNHKDIIPRPPRSKPGQAKPRDNGKYCTYHEEADHTTNICWELKNAIEHLIQSGQLSQYRTPTTGANAIEVYGQILTIHGGTPRAPETFHAQK
ncbi:uncharacterized protein LOC133711501 [Rosa rugosa]|uniref:uncharacterized protein LOC133711501 n=1 Tax=Rosa rugosa TaxID=74645 RepID=UPI002B40DC4F|nr:uncharacterized protein LOC133711501 [Rosa rugosa]